MVAFLSFWKKQAWLLVFLIFVVFDWIIYSYLPTQNLFQTGPYITSFFVSLGFWYLAHSLQHFLHPQIKSLYCWFIGHMVVLFLVGNYYLFVFFGEYSQVYLARFIYENPLYFWNYFQTFGLGPQLLPAVVLIYAFKRLWQDSSPQRLSPKKRMGSLIFGVLALLIVLNNLRFHTKLTHLTPEASFLIAYLERDIHSERDTKTL